MSNTKPNVMFVADHLKVGGAERHMVALASYLAGRAWSVSVMPILRIEDLVEALVENGVEDLVFCDARRGVDFQAARRIALAADSRKVELLVATSQHSLLMATLARRHMTRPAPVIFISHSMGIVLRSLREKLKFLVYRFFYNRADRVVFVSHLQEAFFRRMGVRPRSCKVIHNGVDLSRFSAADLLGYRRLREAQGFLATDIVIGLCAGLRVEKRQNDLLAAIAALREAGLPAKGLLIGEGTERGAIEARRRELGLDQHVVLAGLQQDVAPWVGACDIMTLVSSTETFPISTLEGMAMGKPLVASNVGGMSEQLTDGLNGFLYPSGDVAALTERLTRLFDAALREQMGKAARLSMEAAFSEQKMLADFEREFLALIQRS